MSSDALRKCYEFERCGNYVSGRALACSATCRRRHADRLRRDRESGRDARIVAGESGQEVVRDVLREELRPLIRESLTDATIDQIKALIDEALPGAVQAAIEDLDSTDDTIRQRAYTLIFKHTMGSQVVVPPKDEADTGNLTVYFNLPRPAIADGAGALPATIETKTCDSCGVDKDVSEFEQASDRCKQCFASMRASAATLVGSDSVVQRNEE